MTPKFIKFNYRNKERVWLRVIKYENNYYYGYKNNNIINNIYKYLFKSYFYNLIGYNI